MTQRGHGPSTRSCTSPSVTVLPTQPSSINPSDPSAGSTRDELEFRGGDAPAGTRTELESILDNSASDSIGRRVSFHDVDVAILQDGSFWIHDGNARVQVLPPTGAGAVRNGQVVDVSGVVESDGGTGIRIRADRVTVR